MVYQNKLVAAIKVGGKILREIGDSVAIPFGSEYSVLVKNLHAVRAKFKLSIDGADTTSGTWIIVPPNGDVEMERFIRDGNWESGNRFKFIERTAEVEAHRGTRVDDGIVRVEFQVERVRPVVDVPRYEYYDVPVPNPWHPPYPWYPKPRPYPWRGPTFAAGGSGQRGMRSRAATNTNCADPSFGNEVASSSSFAGESTPTLASDIGITVAGSVSHQRFVAGEWFETGPSEAIVIRLRGAIGAKLVTHPITVKTKVTCASCGKSSESTAEFCERCGTALRTA